MSQALNPFEVLVVTEELRKLGVENYTMQYISEGIWVSYGQVHSYYLFRDGKLVDVQFD